MITEIQAVDSENILCPELQKMIVKERPHIMIVANLWLEGPVIDFDLNEIFNEELLERDEFLFWTKIDESGYFSGTRGESASLRIIPNKGSRWTMEEPFEDLCLDEYLRACFEVAAASFYTHIRELFPWPGKSENESGQ
jgi:hypothetical protein